MQKSISHLLLIIFLSACITENQHPADNSLKAQLASMENQESNPDYLNTPFVAAGDRLYIVGHQDGSFPDLGWHVPGEMGGVWDHPIKLMDGYSFSITRSGSTSCLDDAQKFYNYPIGNSHVYELEDITATRSQFVPDGLEGAVVELQLENTSKSDMNIEVKLTGFVDLTPVWLTERLNIQDEADSIYWDDELDAFIGKDNGNPWFVVFGFIQESDDFDIGSTECSFERKGHGQDASISADLQIPSGKSGMVKAIIAGSYQSLDEAKSTFRQIKESSWDLLERKKQRYSDFSQQAQLNIPDKELEEMYNWVRYNTDWLIREVDTTGRGLSAGIPDYPWWFGADNAYSLQGLLAIGWHKEALNTIELINKLSRKVNDNGRVMHEASTNSIVFNPGNLNETPHFIYLLWKYYEWTGDLDFLQAQYPSVVAGLQWMMDEQDLDNNLYPDGPGMMEIHGLHSEMIDVVVYTQQAFEVASMMAEQLGKEDDASDFRSKASSLKEKINTEWWVEEFGSFADFRATKDQGIELIEAAMVRADTIDKPWSREELEETLAKVKAGTINGTDGFVVHHNWVVNTPMEMGIADPEKAQKALATARNYTNRFGMYVTGMDRDENMESAEKWKSFSYVGAVMTLPTGVQAISEARYGNPDRSLEYLKMLHNSFGYALPGSLYEVSPDYGMITQAWTIYSVAVPIVEYFFGLKPMAYDKTVNISPRMPSDWEVASISNVKVGANSISISKNINEFEINQSDSNWTLSFSYPTPFSINGEAVQANGQGVYTTSFSGANNTITLSK